MNLGEPFAASPQAVTKPGVLAYIAAQGAVTSADVAETFGWTLAGAASTLLRYHRHGHLRRCKLWRRRQSDRRRWGFAGFVYQLSGKGAAYLEWVRE